MVWGFTYDDARNRLPIYRSAEHTSELQSRPHHRTALSLHDALPISLTKPIAPFFIHLVNQSIYFPRTREQYLPISEVMVHYLLLYNLSMLSRYETEWWGDLLMTMPEIDYPFIVHFLNETANKIPTLLGYDLYLLHQTYSKK